MRFLQPMRLAIALARFEIGRHFLFYQIDRGYRPFTADFEFVTSYEIQKMESLPTA